MHGCSSELGSRSLMVAPLIIMVTVSNVTKGINVCNIIIFQTTIGLHARLSTLLHNYDYARWRNKYSCQEINFVGRTE